MNETTRVLVNVEFLALYGCLALMWLAFAVASHFAYLRLRAEPSIRLWSFAWYCAVLQLVTFLLARAWEGSASRGLFVSVMVPNQVVGYLQPGFLLLAAWATFRKPERRDYWIAVGASVVAAGLTVVTVRQVPFQSEAEAVRFLLTPKLLLLSGANVLFGVLYWRMAKRRSASEFRIAVAVSCALQAVHQGLIAANHLTDGMVYFAATSMPAALIGIVVGVAMVLSLFFELTASAQRSNAAKSAFLSTMTHELRTPLAGLIGLTSIFASARTEGERAEVVTSIDHCARSVLALVDDILDVARIEEGRTEAQLGPVSVAGLLDEVTSMFRLAAAEKGVLLETVVESKWPELVTTDGPMLKRIVLNLVGNALKFTAAGSVEIRVGYEEPGQLRIAVVDTGCGIPAADQRHLMERFYQASNAVAASSRGTGLGLFLSNQWVRLLGGEGLVVRSELGVGSEFSFSIPARAAARPAKVAPMVIEMPAARGLRVLVAEDNRVNQLVLMRMLEKLGHSPLLAVDGNEAVARWQQEQPDVILMDYRMPGLDGPAATRLIREREAAGSRVPIIAVTANALAEQRDSCLAAGMDDYLSKPVTLQQLALAIDRYR